jgi:hypothetical protein
MRVASPLTIRPPPPGSLVEFLVQIAGRDFFLPILQALSGTAGISEISFLANVVEYGVGNLISLINLDLCISFALATSVSRVSTGRLAILKLFPISA